jgi:hypothetical protein
MRALQSKSNFFLPSRPLQHGDVHIPCKTVSRKKLMSTDPAEARCSGIMSWFSSVVHPSYQRSHHPSVSQGEAAQTAVKDPGLNHSGPIARRSTPWFKEKTGS